MVHGSGALDHDETVFKNKPFRDIAEGLADRGVSSLRYDKRTYVYPNPVSTMDDETILDALSAIKTAHKYSKRVYLLGHSLGAMLAPIIAQKAFQDSDKTHHPPEGIAMADSDKTYHPLEGIIMMAAPARNMEEIVREQISYLSPSGASDRYKNEQIEKIKQQSPHYFEPQNQIEAAQKLKIPILTLQGGRDYQVTSKDLEIWRKSLSGRENASFFLYPTLNHLFMTGEGPSTPLEYQIEGHMSEEVLNDIRNFIK